VSEHGTVEDALRGRLAANHISAHIHQSDHSIHPPIILLDTFLNLTYLVIMQTYCI